MNVQALPMHRFIDHDGNLVGQLPNWADIETLVGFYRDMVLTRTYDQKAVALQRTGKLGTYPSHLGSEAIGIAVGRALKTDDVFVPYYRDMPAMWCRGIGMEKTFNIGAAMSAAVTSRQKAAQSQAETCHFVFQSQHNVHMRSALLLR